MPMFKGCVACGANRIGKSRLGGFVTAMIVTGQHPRYKSPKDGRAWIVGLDSNVIEAVEKPYFEMFMPKRYMDAGKWNGKFNYWTFKVEGREWEVWFKSVDSGRKKFQGDAIDFAWIDEEPLKDGVFKELEARMMDREAPWLMTATPIEGTKWLKDTLDRIDVYYTMAGMRENPYIPMSEIDLFVSTHTQDDCDVRVEGKYIIFGGRPVFDRRIISLMENNAIPFTEGILGLAG
jgi:phage terminase large subunit-like protein